MNRHERIPLPSGGAEGAATLAPLPPADTSRWVARRKAEVVDAIRVGRITIEEACRRYRLTVEELSGWQRAFLRHGISGLKVSGLRLEKARGRLVEAGGRWRRGRQPDAPPAGLPGPARRPPPAGSLSAARPPRATRRRGGPQRMLVIDDEPMVARFIAHAAQAHGFETAMTISADAFRRAHDAQDPDVVVVDLAMPGGDGIELLRFLAERRSRAGIVLLSGFDNRVLDSAVRLGRSIGLNMAEPLAKPVTVDQLMAAVGGVGAGTGVVGTSVGAGLGAAP